MKRILFIIIFTLLAGMAMGQDFSQIKARAELGDAEAQSSMGYHYLMRIYNNQAVAQDYAEVIKWFRMRPIKVIVMLSVR